MALKDWLFGTMGKKTKEDRQFEILDGRLIDLQNRVLKLRQEVQQQSDVDRGKFAALATLIENGNREILEAIKSLASVPTKPLEVRFVFKVKNDHQDESFSISVGGVTDKEGEPLPDASGLTVEVSSSDPDVVGVDFDSSTNSGVAHFGHSGVASLTASVKNAAGDILGSGAADFTVTTGDPAAVSDVKIAFGGLAEEPPAEG